MKNVTLRAIDESNFIACFHLELAPGQEEFVSHPIRSLAQAYVYRDQCQPFGVYDSEKLVGYVMVIYDYDEACYNIWHLMIDKDHQGNGYGKAAMQRVLEYIRTKPFGPSDTVLITCNPENIPVVRLYSSLGFRQTGRSDEDEVELGLTLTKA